MPWEADSDVPPKIILRNGKVSKCSFAGQFRLIGGQAIVDGVWLSSVGG